MAEIDQTQMENSDLDEQESDGADRPGKRKSHAEVRDATVQAGLEELLNVGLEAGIATVKFEDAIARSGIARATAYRAWSGDDEGRPQARFQVALGEQLLKTDRQNLVGSTLSALEPYLEKIASDDFGLMSARERGLLLMDILRDGGNAYYRSARDDALGNMQAGFAAFVRLHSGVQPTSSIQELLAKIGEENISQYEAIYAQMAVAFGLKVRHGFTMRQFSFLVASLGEGLLLRPYYVDSHLGVDLDSETPDGWSMNALGLMSLCRFFFENDPASEIETDLDVLSTDGAR